MSQNKTVYAADRFRGGCHAGRTPASNPIAPDSQKPLHGAAEAPPIERQGLQGRLYEIRKALSVIQGLMNDLKARDSHRGMTGGEP
jgi:hypothetical protein